MIRHYGSNKELVDTIYKIVDRHSKEVPVPVLNDIMTSIWFLKGTYEFDKGNIERGDACLQKAEKLAAGNKDITIDHDLVSQAYGAVYAYYYMRNKMNTASTYVQRGLKVDPANLTLLGYQQTLNRWQGIDTPTGPVPKPTGPPTTAPPAKSPPRTVIVRTNKQ